LSWRVSMDYIQLCLIYRSILRAFMKHSFPLDKSTRRKPRWLEGQGGDQSNA
jgi:hypothetical protein